MNRSFGKGATSATRNISKQAAAEAQLASAMELHEHGRLTDAERIYRSVLGQDPGHFGANHLLGLVFLQQGQFEVAERQIGRAIRIRPNDASALSSRGIALHSLNRFDEALANFDKAIAAQPDFADALGNRGNTLHALRRFEEAVASYDEVIARKPNSPEAFNNRGNALLELGRPLEALGSFDKAILLKRNYAEAYNNRGLVLASLQRLEEALASYERAISLRPNYAEAFGNRGNVLGDLGRAEEALASYNQAIALKADFVEAFSNRAVVLYDLGRFDEALAGYDRAIALKPDFARAFSDRSYLQLLFGQFAQGWEDFEYRWQMRNFRPHVSLDELSLRVKKETLQDKRVLVVAEQGVGDEIMFSGMIPDLVRNAGHVTLECDPRLGALFGRSFPQAEIIPRASPPIWRAADFDARIPSGSLGRLYRNACDDFPQRKRYLAPNDDLVVKWRERLSSLGSDLKIGISWKGGTDRTHRARRSIPLELWRPILDVEGVSFVNLQYGDATSDIEAARIFLSKPITCFEPAQIDDFDNLLGLVEALDLVISVQTSLVHLSGAGGKPCWVMVPYAAEWRYGMNTSMPWYSSVKLYRQQDHGEWRETVANVASDLAAFAKKT